MTNEDSGHGSSLEVEANAQPSMTEDGFVAPPERDIKITHCDKGGKEFKPFDGKKREFAILVAVLGELNQVARYVTFPTLESAQSFVEMRERLEGLKCHLTVVEHNPAIVGTMTFTVIIAGQSTGDSAEEVSP